MFKTIAHIIIGWAKRFKLIRTSLTEAQLSKRRLAICEKCPKAKYSRILEILNGRVNYVDSLQCTKCSCPCLEKTLVIDEKCPLKKW